MKVESVKFTACVGYRRGMNVLKYIDVVSIILRVVATKSNHGLCNPINVPLVVPIAIPPRLKLKNGQLHRIDSSWIGQNRLHGWYTSTSILSQTKMRLSG